MELRKIRNYITHNNGVAGTKKEKDVNSLINGIQGVSIYDGNVAIDDLNFILDVHKKIYSILDELSTKLNY
ncbi:MAG: hypothetical protein R3Y59_09750 [bacterium]